MVAAGQGAPAARQGPRPEQRAQAGGAPHPAGLAAAAVAATSAAAVVQGLAQAEGGPHFAGLTAAAAAAAAAGVTAPVAAAVRRAAEQQP